MQKINHYYKNKIHTDSVGGQYISGKLILGKLNNRYKRIESNTIHLYIDCRQINITADDIKSYGIKKYNASKEMWTTVCNARSFHESGLIYISSYNRLLIMGGTVNGEHPLHKKSVHKTNEIWIFNPETGRISKSHFFLPICANLKRRVAVICDDSYTEKVIAGYVPRNSDGEYQFLFPKYLIQQILQYLVLYILHVFDQNGDHYTANIDSLLQL